VVENGGSDLKRVAALVGDAGDVIWGERAALVSIFTGPVVPRSSSA
jgi:hypothetical protein